MTDETIDPKSPQVQQALADLEASIATFARLQDRIDGDVVDMAEMFGALSQHKADLSALHYRASRVLANMLDGNELVIEGVGTVKRWRGKRRKNWEHQRLIENVRARARDEIECDDDGVVVVDETEALLRALQRCARFEWKVTGLVDMGIDADHFCETEEAPATASFKPAGK